MAVTISADSLPTAASIVEPSPMALLRRRIFGHSGMIIGGAVLIFIVLVALTAPFLAPHDPYDQDLSRRLITPIWHGGRTWEHPLGTDELGRDYLSRVMYGARISLLIGFSVMVVSGIIGTALGISAGYFGGRVDMIITFIITTRLAMPATLVALGVVGLTGGSFTIVIIVLGLLLWDRFAVVGRSIAQQIRNLDYITAAEAAGCSLIRILITEVLPNMANAVIVVATLEVANAILFEAAFSFLGFGVQPPTPSWGLMIAEGKGHMFFRPWLINIPGICLFALLLSINMLGDG
ncbi:MAG: ABC transporter permease subunit, partial [Deltaproteobacteria bacterium]|nr:ABC transporter permease subunit [Deltaproteobacteria bacterium]